MQVQFTKMAGAGNDFVVMGPQYAGLLARAPGLARAICERRRSVGADGLIIVEEAGKGILMHYFNSDGSEASFCGNGARCLVLYCVEKGIASGQFAFESNSGRHRGEVTGGGVRVSMDSPRLLGDHMLDLGGDSRLVTLAEAGVPHAVLISDDVGREDVGELGRAIRTHIRFRPDGANADFVGLRAGEVFPIRTYERGVEKETLACGSGCVAAALVLRSKNLTGSRTSFRVASGDVLTVELPREGAGGQAYLTGPAAIVYEGHIELKE